MYRTHAVSTSCQDNIHKLWKHYCHIQLWIKSFIFPTIMILYGVIATFGYSTCIGQLYYQYSFILTYFKIHTKYSYYMYCHTYNKQSVTTYNTQNYSFTLVSVKSVAPTFWRVTSTLMMEHIHLKYW
jgi:hypothetical protein